METTPATRTNSTQLETRSLLREFDRLQRDLRTHLDQWSGRDMFDGMFTPVADVEETDDAYLVEIELAGVKRSDVDITTTGRRLTVTGERKEKERVGVLRRRNRTVGEFRYEIELPAEFDTDHVEAGFEDGVLSIRLPKTQADRPRRIAIN